MYSTFCRREKQRPIRGKLKGTFKYRTRAIGHNLDALQVDVLQVAVVEVQVAAVSFLVRELHQVCGCNKRTGLLNVVICYSPSHHHCVDILCGYKNSISAAKDMALMRRDLLWASSLGLSLAFISSSNSADIGMEICHKHTMETTSPLV